MQDADGHVETPLHAAGERFDRLAFAIRQRRPIERSFHRFIERGSAQSQIAAKDREVLVRRKIGIERNLLWHNANLGARRVRECIFAVLPPFFVEEAKELCVKTLTDGGGKPLAQRVADAVKAFDGVGVIADQLEQKLGRTRDKWTELDVAQLGVTFKSLQRGEVTKEEEFPPQRVTAAEITGTATATPAGE